MFYFLLDSSTLQENLIDEYIDNLTMYDLNLFQFSLMHSVNRSGLPSLPSQTKNYLYQ